MAQRYGSWGARAGALLLDGLIVAVVFAILLAILGGDGWVTLLAWLVALGAYTGLTMTRGGERNGQTLGKQAVNVRVIRDDGQPITWKTVCAARGGPEGLGWRITFGIGGMADILWPLGEGQNRSLHDLIVRTHVVDTSPAPQPQTPLHWAPPMPQLAPPIAAHLNAAYGLRGRIVALDPRSADDITVIVSALQTSAGRAQQLWDALSETSPKRCSSGWAGRAGRQDRAGRGAAPAAGGAAADGRAAQPLSRRVRARAGRAGDDPGDLVSASASTDNDNREQLTATVRALRDETHALSAGTMAAYGEAT